MGYMGICYIGKVIFGHQLTHGALAACAYSSLSAFSIGRLNLRIPQVFPVVCWLVRALFHQSEILFSLL